MSYNGNAEAIVPEMGEEQEEEEISDRQIQNMVDIFQMEDEQEQGNQQWHRIVDMIFHYNYMIRIRRPIPEIINFRATIERAIIDAFYVTQNIVIRRDELLSTVERIEAEQRRRQQQGGPRQLGQQHQQQPQQQRPRM